MQRDFEHCSVSPTLYVLAEYVPLFRDSSDPLRARPLVPNGTLALGTGALDSEFAGGARLLLGLALGDWYRLELSSLGYYSWSDTAVAQTANEFASLHAATDMDSIDLNLRRRLCVAQCPYYSAEASAIIGVRYMRLHDDLDYFARLGAGDPPTATSRAAVAAENELIGIQIGALSQFLAHDRAWIDFEIKGGIFSNAASVDSAYSATNGASGTSASFIGKEDRTCFMGDLSLVLNYQFAPAWTVRAGYNAIWLTGLALASQNTSSDATRPPVNLEHSGQMVLHGPSIGLVWAH